MKICPNLSDPAVKEQWDSLVNHPELGKMEAMREFMEAAIDNRDVLTPESVVAKMRTRAQGLSKEEQDAEMAAQEAAIQAKSNDPVLLTDPNSLYGNAALMSDMNTREMNTQNNSNTRGIELATKLSQQLGVGFEMVSPEEAVRITGQSKNPYNATKGPAFFYQGTVYFVGSNINTETAFHEFSHPLIRTIQQTNPELFQKLVNKAIEADSRLLEEVKAEYADLLEAIQNEADPRRQAELIAKYQNIIGEELLVKALAKSAQLKSNNLQASSPFAKFINDLLYALKQLLRGKFGKTVDVAQLSASTTLDQLAEMLVKGGQIKIDTIAVSDKDVVAYMDEFNDYLKDLKEATETTDAQELTDLARRMYTGASEQIDLMMKNPNYREMLELFVDDYNRGDLQEMRSNVAKYAKQIQEKMQGLADEIDTTRNEATAVITSLLRLEVMMKKMEAHLEKLAKEVQITPTTFEEEEAHKDAVHKAHYYAHVLGYWQGYIKDANAMMTRSKLNEKAPLNNLLNGIQKTMERSAAHVNTMNNVGMTEVLWDQWKDMADAAEKLFKDQIAVMVKNGADRSRVDKAYIEFYGMPEEGVIELKALQARKNAGERLTGDDAAKYANLHEHSLNGLQVTKERITAALKGEGKDANWANSYLEGYLYSTDPIIGGFAKYYKSNMIEMEARAQSRHAETMAELSPLLEDAGISFVKIADLGKRLGFVDHIGHFDKATKQYIKKEVYTLLNPTKDHRYAVDKYAHDIKLLQDAYNKNKSPENKRALSALISEKNNHMKQWFHQKYVDEFYEPSQLLEGALGEQAAAARAIILDEIGIVQSKAMSEFDIMNSTDQLKNLWKEYQALYSTYSVHNIKKTNSYVDDAGVLHTSDTFIEEAPGRNNIMNDLAIAERLTEYKNATRDFYKWTERKGVFQNALQNFEKELTLKITENYLDPKPTDPAGAAEWEDQFQSMFETYRNEWIKKNTRIKIKPEFYEKRAELLARAKALTSKLPSSKATDVDFTEYWADILDTVSGFRDDDGQPIGNEIPETRIDNVKRSQQAMEDAKNAWAGFSGLTQEEMDRLMSHTSALKEGKKLSTTDSKDLAELIERQKVDGLNDFEKAELNGIFADLRELQRKEPTEYYLNAVNQFLNEINDPDVYKALGTTELDVNNIEDMYAPDTLALLMKNAKFKEWFDKNHIKKLKYNKETKKKEVVYERLYIWNIVKPNDESMYETTMMIHPDGTKEFIPGIPKNQYFSRSVKKEYYTGYDAATDTIKPIVGLHRDNSNTDNGWLPKQIKGSPYYNEEYFKLKDAAPGTQDAKLFKILEVLTKNHLINQEGLGKNAKLYLDYARYEKGNLEAIQDKKLKGAKENIGAIQSIFRKIKNFFLTAKSDAGVNFNYDLNKQLVRASAFDDMNSNIPIQGIYDMNVNDVSKDFITTMFQYLWSAEEHKQLIKMNPVATGLKKILDDPDNNNLKDMDRINEANHTNRGMTTYMNKKGKYIRKDAFSNLYNRQFRGEVNAGVGKNWVIIQNIQRALFGRASFSFFAFNIPSALKNAMSAKFQALIHSAGGQDVTLSTLVRGEAWSANYMTKLSLKNAYSKGTRSLEHLIGEAFDPIEGRVQDNFGKSVSRTLVKDMSTSGWFTNFRKWTELQASMQTFGAMMFKQQVEMNGKMVDYMSVWEVSPTGKLQLKAGVDPKWGITYDAEGKPIVGEEFKKFKMRVHGVMNKLNGAYSKFGQPEAQRYMAFRFVSFLRRYFTTMAMNRFGNKRWNPGYGSPDEGYYVTAAKSFFTLIKTRNVNNMTPADKKAWMKFVVEAGSIYLMGLLIGVLWGWDDDDEDRFAKLRERSSFLKTPGTREYQPGEQFDFGGFISLHAMNLMMQVQAENQQFMPGPGLKSMSNMLDLKSLAFGPTTDTYQQIGGDLIDIWDNEGGQYYKRRVGAYEWQDQGGLKLWAHIAKSFGLNAGNIDPAQAITNFQKAQELSTKR